VRPLGTSCAPLRNQISTGTAIIGAWAGARPVIVGIMTRPACRRRPAARIRIARHALWHGPARLRHRRFGAVVRIARVVAGPGEPHGRRLLPVLSSMDSA